MGHQPVFQGFLHLRLMLSGRDRRGWDSGHQDFLSHTDEQIGIGGQEGINEIKMLHHHTLTPVYCLHNGVRQLMGLGEAHFKANVHMVCMGREEAGLTVLVHEGKGADIDAAVVVGELQSGEHAPDQDALSRSAVANDANELVKGAQVHLGNLNAQIVNPVPAPGCIKGTENMASLHSA